MDGGDGHRERRGGLADAMNVNGGSENDKRKIDERKIVGRDRSSRTTPPHLRVPAQRASGAGRGISRAYDALVKSPGTGQWDPAIIGATLTVTVGQATTVHRRGTPLDEEWDEPGYGVVALPPATRGAYNAAGRRVWLWPAILRLSVGGTDVRRITGHMAAAQLSWEGGSPTTSARPPALWSWGLGLHSACGSEHGCGLTQMPPGLTGFGLRERPEPGERGFRSRGFRGDGLRRHSLRGNEVFMCGLPHAARRRARSPVA